LKSTVSQLVEMMKNKDGSQRVEIDATPPFSVGSVSVGMSPDVTPGEDREARLDIKHVEGKINLIAAQETKKNSK